VFITPKFTVNYAFQVDNGAYWLKITFQFISVDWVPVYEIPKTKIELDSREKWIFLN